MSDSIPFLGSKISLISKSEIRYEGILYTIDAQDSIIVLTKVQSFGTEDRPADLAVPAKNDIYEYIIFRGTDIKKIEVCDPPKHHGLHNDPAIVSLQVQQQVAPTVTASSYPGTSFSHQPLGAIGSVGNYYGGYNQPLSQQNIPTSGFSIGVSQPSEFSSGIGGVSVESQSPSAIRGDSSGGNSSQPLPAPIGAPLQSTMSPQSQQQQQHQDVLAGSRSSTPSVSRKSPVADAGVQVSPPQQQHQVDKKRVAIQSNQRQTPERQTRDGQSNMPRRGQYHQGPNQFNNQGQRYNQGYQGGNQGYYQGQQYQGGQYRGGTTGRGRAPRRAQGQRGGRGVFNQGTRQRQDQQLFEKEFDFEQANVQFEELRTQMANTKISENGDKKDEKKDDSGHETATTGDESEDSSSSVYYDKTKSFFDSISCEALERSKGKSQRSDWRQERKINVQTFGVATARRGYYPRGRGGYYNRGGYYRNYNQGYYRGNSNNYRGGPRGGGGGVNGGTGNMNRTSNYNGTAGGNAGAGGVPNPGSSGNSYASAVRSATGGPGQ